MYFGAAKAKCTLVILVIGLSFSLLVFPRTECICSRDFQSFCCVLRECFQALRFSFCALILQKFLQLEA